MPNQQKIWTTQELCKELMKRRSLQSNYALGKYTGITDTTTLRWLKGKSIISDDFIPYFAEQLGIDVGYLFTCIAIERVENSEMSEVITEWLRKMSEAESQGTQVKTRYQ